MDTNDLNEWITWFSNVIRELNGKEWGELIEQLKKGDEKSMCSSFERLLNKRKSGGQKQRAGQRAKQRVGHRAKRKAEWRTEQKL